MLKTIKKNFHKVIGPSVPHQSAVEAISKWETGSCSPPHLLLFDAGRGEVTRYLQAFDSLLQSPTDNDALISAATARLIREFSLVLGRLTRHQVAAAPNPPVSTTEWSSVTDSTGHLFRFDDYAVPTPPDDGAIDYLRNITERMISMGTIGDCVKDYIQGRRSFLESHLKLFRFDEVVVYEEVPLHILKLRMDIWVEISKICVIYLFQHEKHLCEQIFGDNEGFRDKCFTGSVGEIALKLFRFARGISFPKHQPYHEMESVLGLYSCFISLKSEVDALFVTKRGEYIRNLCQETLVNIENEMERMLRYLMNDVVREHFEDPDDSCEVLKLTRDVMQQVNLIATNGDQLASLIRNAPFVNMDDLNIDKEKLQHRNRLDLHLIFIVAALLRKLEKKSESYKKESPRLLFMMTNVHFMIQYIEGSSKLQGRIDPLCIHKLKDDFDLKARSYFSSTCNKLKSCFDGKGLHQRVCFKCRLRNEVVKRIKVFNSALEKLQSPDHPLRAITDLGLRKRVCNLLHDTLVPGYKNFLHILENDREMKLLLQENVKYPPENLHQVIYEMLSVHS